MRTKPKSTTLLHHAARTIHDGTRGSRGSFSLLRWIVVSCAFGCASLHAQASDAPHTSNSRHAHQTNVVNPQAGSHSRAIPIPALPAGVSELKFSDFFVSPVGRRGLEVTDKLRQFDRKRVRILG